MPVLRGLCLVSFTFKDLIIILPLHNPIQPGHNYPSKWMEGIPMKKAIPRTPRAKPGVAEEIMITSIDRKHPLTMAPNKKVKSCSKVS